MSEAIAPDRRAVAYHEAGHAVLALVYDVPFVRIWIAPDDTGMVEGLQWPEDHPPELFALQWAGGAAAQEIVCGHTWGCQGDAEVAETIVGTAGLAKLLEAAKEAVRAHWPAVEILAGALLERGGLTYAEASALAELHSPDRRSPSTG